MTNPFKSSTPKPKKVRKELTRDQKDGRTFCWVMGVAIVVIGGGTYLGCQSSWSADRKVHVGMTAAEVVELYGMPAYSRESDSHTHNHINTWHPFRRDFYAEFKDGILIEGAICQDGSNFCDPIPGSKSPKKFLREDESKF